MPTGTRKPTNTVRTGLENLNTLQDLRRRQDAAAQKSFDQATKIGGTRGAARTFGTILGQTLGRRFDGGAEERAKAVDSAIKFAQEQADTVERDPDTPASVASIDRNIDVLRRTQATLNEQGITSQDTQITENIEALVVQRQAAENAILELEGKELKNQKTRKEIDLEGQSRITAIPGGGSTNGEAVTGTFDQETSEFTFERDGKVIKTKEFQEVRIQGGAEETQLDKVAFRNNNKALRNLRQSQDLINDVRELIVNNRNDVSLRGRVVAKVNGVESALRSFVNDKLDAGEKEDLTKDTEAFKKELTTAGITDIVRQNAIINLAYASAIANGNDRPTDKDFEVGRQSLGADNYDPEVAIAGLDNLSRANARRLEDITTQGDGKFNASLADRVAGRFATNNELQLADPSRLIEIQSGGKRRGSSLAPIDVEEEQAALQQSQQRVQSAREQLSQLTPQQRAEAIARAKAKLAAGAQ